MHKIYLNTGRNCLIYIIKAFKIKEIYIPYYYCPSVRLAIAKKDCKINFYHIDKDFKCDADFPKDAYIVYPNYFGICSKNADEMSEKYKNLITDNAHSFFSKPKGIVSFTSLRKFFPSLRDGAVLYTEKLCDDKFPKDLFTYKQKNLTYEEICKNENRLDKENIKLISDYTRNYFKNTDLEAEKQKYINNFEYWHNKLKSINCLTIDKKEEDIPFGYPYLAKTDIEAQNIAKELSKSGYIIFRYWNNMPNSFEEKIFYTNLIVIQPYRR